MTHIIHNDIILTKDDLPGLFFYKEEEVSKADADYDRVIGSMKDFYDFYHRYVLENDEFHIYGNYYTINSKSLKEVVRVRIKDGDIFKQKRYEVKDIKVIKDVKIEEENSEEDKLEENN